MPTTRLRISKLDDNTDTAHLEKALESVPGVQTVEINPATNEAIVEHQGADEHQLTHALRSQGYISEVA